MLRLEKITPANFNAAIGVTVRADQAHLVAPVVKSLAEAYVHPETAWPRLILDGDRAVGFLMAFFDAELGGIRRSGLWRLNIADGEQGRGYGRFAVESVAAEIRRRGGTRLAVSWVPGENSPEAFYLKLGFRLTGEVDDGELVGELEL
ncbi:GNAT family N-acetyltransferase [Actinophytocola algeriensis]|nr:GNAT family N-acetyltransferase [Actinophytocola algeriensis]MBE1475272.1 diamine N-acetyltransferase [Actinophytocola algeriensis]